MLVINLTALPPSAPGMRIGLFGGSFDPPHAGHRLVALEALKRLHLDAVWLLVTPGNPLKPGQHYAPLADRMAALDTLLDHPRLHVTGFEAGRNLRYSVDTIATIRRLLPGRDLVWIMGADNLAGFHRWEHWEAIAATIPIAVYPRPGAHHRALAGRAATALTRYRIDEADAPRLASLRAPAWVYLTGPMSSLSSTAIRGTR